VGKADKRWGQVPVAVVVGTADEGTIMLACQSLAKFKRPADIVFVDALPRNALGKILVHQLENRTIDNGLSMKRGWPPQPLLSGIIGGGGIAHCMAIRVK